MQTKNLPKWAKILAVIVPVLAISLFVVFGGDIIGGQGMIRKNPLIKPTTPETLLPGTRPSQTSENSTGKSTDKVVPPLKKPLADPLEKPSGVVTGQMEKVITGQVSTALTQQLSINAVDLEYFGGQLYAYYFNQNQYIENGSKTTMLYTAITDDENGELQYIKETMVSVLGKGSCTNAFNCIEIANIELETDTNKKSYSGIVSKTNNTIAFNNMDFKINDGEIAKLKVVVKLKKVPPALGGDTSLAIQIAPKYFKIVDQKGKTVKLRSGNSSVFQGDTYIVKFE